MSIGGPWGSARGEVKSVPSDLDRLLDIEDFFLKLAASPLLLFASPPDFSQNQTAVSDALHLSSDFQLDPRSYKNTRFPNMITMVELLDIFICRRTATPPFHDTATVPNMPERRLRS